VTWQEDGNCSEGIPVNKQEHHDHDQHFSNSAIQQTINNKRKSTMPKKQEPRTTNVTSTALPHTSASYLTLSLPWRLTGFTSNSCMKIMDWGPPSTRMERLWACGGFINMILNSEESGEVCFVKVEKTVVRSVPMSDKAQWMLVCEGDPHDVSQRESNCRTGMEGMDGRILSGVFITYSITTELLGGLVSAGQLIRTLLVSSCLTTAIQNRSCLFGMIDLPKHRLCSVRFLLTDAIFCNDRTETKSARNPNATNSKSTQ
jgi:hypothetical protein